jgi:hypothetical protein
MIFTLTNIITDLKPTKYYTTQTQHKTPFIDAHVDRRIGMIWCYSRHAQSSILLLPDNEYESSGHDSV